MPYGTLAADQISTSVTGVSLGAGNATRFKNKIINGDCRIDQRNAGASITPASAAYMVDRFQYYAGQASKFTAQQNAGSVTPPAGFTNYLGMTVASAVTIGATDYFNVRQCIEGLNIADLAWGTANAKTVTLSFWVYSSLTGTFGGCFSNSAENRLYPFSYSIPVANTWTQVSITVAGDTSGTWLTTNGIGIKVIFSLGTGSTYSGTPGAWTSSSYFSATGSVSVVGTAGAIWYITGVQLEVGSSATGFEYVDYTTQLAMCQRYYYKNLSGAAIASLGGQGAFSSSSVFIAHFVYAIPMRTSPSFSVSGANIGNGANGTGISSVGTAYIGPNSAQIIINATSSPFAAGNGGYLYDSGAGTGFVAFSAEL